LALAEDKRNSEALADVLDKLHSEGRVEALIVFFNSLRKDGEPDICNPECMGSRRMGNGFSVWDTPCSALSTRAPMQNATARKV